MVTFCSCVILDLIASITAQATISVVFPENGWGKTRNHMLTVALHIKSNEKIIFSFNEQRS